MLGMDESLHKTLVLPVSDHEQNRKAIERATAILREGGMVVAPTETVYGMAANALDARAVSGIFRAKDRPAENPLIVHVENMEMARAIVTDWPKLADKLAAAFWPGPLSLVLHKATVIPDIVTAGGGTVAVRQPAHTVMHALIRECGFPLAAPSANRSNQLSPTTAGHVLRQLDGRVPLILDAGPCQVGIESTVIDLTGSPPAILRPGMISEQALNKVTGTAEKQEASCGILKSPGQLGRHYAPKVPLHLAGPKEMANLTGWLIEQGVEVERVFVVARSELLGEWSTTRQVRLQANSVGFANGLYAALHRCEAEGARAIVVEAPPNDPEWQAIGDRLERASTRVGNL